MGSGDNGSRDADRTPADPWGDVGRSVAGGAGDMSQQAFADAMEAGGVKVGKWTLIRYEKGESPVPEAVATWVRDRMVTETP